MLEYEYCHYPKYREVTNRGDGSEGTGRWFSCYPETDKVVYLSSKFDAALEFDVLPWLHQHVGENGVEWFLPNRCCIIIRDDSAAFEFKMRWC